MSDGNPAALGVPTIGPIVLPSVVYDALLSFMTERETDFLSVAAATAGRGKGLELHGVKFGYEFYYGDKTNAELADAAGNLIEQAKLLKNVAGKESLASSELAMIGRFLSSWRSGQL